MVTYAGNQSPWVNPAGVPALEQEARDSFFARSASAVTPFVISGRMGSGRRRRSGGDSVVRAPEGSRVGGKDGYVSPPADSTALYTEIGQISGRQSVNRAPGTRGANFGAEIEASCPLPPISAT